MKAKIVRIVDLKKTAAEREAEELLAQLDTDKAIDVTLEGPETPRKISRLFRKAASNIGKTITVRTRGDKLIIRLQQKS